MNRSLQFACWTLLFLLLALVAAASWLAITIAFRSYETPGGVAGWLGDFKISLWFVSFQTKPLPKPDNTGMFAVLLGAILLVVATLCLIVRFERRERESSRVPLAVILGGLAVGLEAKSNSLHSLSRRLETMLPPPENLSPSSDSDTPPTLVEHAP